MSQACKFKPTHLIARAEAELLCGFHLFYRLCSYCANYSLCYCILAYNIQVVYFAHSHGLAPRKPEQEMF